MWKAKTTPSSIESEITSLIVGPKLRELTAHRGYLMNSSFFVACLDRGFKEGEEGLIRLPEDDLDAVEKVLEYLYGNNFDCPNLMEMDGYIEADKVEEEVEEELRNHWVFLARCYVAADKYCLEDLQNKIMNFVKEATKRRRVYASGIQELTKAGLRACPIRRFLLEEMAWELLGLDNEEGLSAEIHQEQTKVLAGTGYDAEDLLLTSLKMGRERVSECPSTRTYKCNWHIHKGSKKCLKEEF